MGVVLDAPWAGSTFNPPTALDIATIETAIVARLSAQVSGLEIAHYPDRPESYRLTHRVGAALVRYDGATYGPLGDVAAVVQRRELKFAIRLMVRDLGWSFGGDAAGPNPGAYALMETMRIALTGYQIGGCGKIYPLRERFVERDQQGGVWVYESIFALTTMAVEPSVPDNFPQFVYGVAQEQGGQTNVAVAAAQYTFNGADQIAIGQGNIDNLVVANATGSITYTSGTDYSLDSVNGIVTRIATGAIAGSATVQIAYGYAEVVTVVASGGSAPTAPTN
jgi:hypothetical protein